MIDIIIPFCPPKKNNRITNRKTGKTFPSKRYQEWHKIASEAISDHIPTNPIESTIEVKMIFKWPDKRRRDMTNFAESIMDLIVDNKMLVDDNWYVCGYITLISGEIDRVNPHIRLMISY